MAIIHHKQITHLMDLIRRVQYKPKDLPGNPYKELGWESLSNWKWASRLIFFYNINKVLAPLYLSEPVNDVLQRYIGRISLIPARIEVICILIIRTLSYGNNSFPYSIKAWRELSEEAKSNVSVQGFRQYLNDLSDLLTPTIPPF